MLIHGSAYHRHARRWAVDAETAHDIVQDAYAKVIATPNWREIASPRAYVLMMVRNVAIDRLRQSKLLPFDKNGERVLAVQEDDFPSAQAAIEGRETLVRVLDAIDALPPQQHKVVVMRKFEGRSTHQIAETLRLSVSTVEKHLTQGLRAAMRAAESPVVVDNKSGSERRDATQGRSGGSGGGLARRFGYRNRRSSSL